MPALLERVISQLDMLVPYLSLAHEEVFALVAKEYNTWCPTPETTPMPNTFEEFKKQIAHAAFVLGFSYADAFFADLIREIFLKHPEMLPEDKKLTFKAIISAENIENVKFLMVNHEVHEIMHNGLEEIAYYFRKKLSITWPDKDLQILITASLIRNCIIHNNSLVDQRLDSRPSWHYGDIISLSVSDVHEFGIVARRVLNHVYNEAKTRHLER